MSRVFFNPFTKTVSSTNSPAFQQLKRHGFDISQSNPYRLRLAKPKLLHSLLASTKPPPKSNTILSTLKSLSSGEAKSGSMARRRQLQLAVDDLIAKRQAAFLEPLSKTSPVASVDKSVCGVKLTEDQDQVLAWAMEGMCLYIGGAAGTGKSLLIRRIAHDLTVEKGLNVAVTATTGIAALGIHGHTFHHVFGVPIEALADKREGDRFAKRATALGVHDQQNGHSGDDMTKITSFDPHALRMYDVVILDEISMLSYEMLCAFDEAARTARLSSEPFGGIQLITSGDFLQLRVPTKNENLPESVVKTYHLFEHPLFEKLTHVALMKPLRQVDDDEFVDSLNRLRHGDKEAALEIMEADGVNTSNLATVRLFPTRRAAAHYNDMMLRQLTGAPHTYRTHFSSCGSAGDWSNTNVVVAPLDSKKVNRHSLPHLVAQRLGEWQVQSDDVSVVDITKPFEKLKKFAIRVRTRGEDGAEHKKVMTDRLNTALVAMEGDRMVTRTTRTDGKSAIVQKALASAGANANREGLLSAKVLKRKSRVMLLRNLTQKLVNGSLGTIVDFKPFNRSLLPKGLLLHVTETQANHIAPISIPDEDEDNDLSAMSTHSDMVGMQRGVLPVVEFDGGDTCQIPVVTCIIPPSAATGYLRLLAETMPLSLAYGFTVHKLQGVTLQQPIIVDCKTMWPCEHLVYVAASRVKSRSHLNFKSFKSDHVIANEKAIEFSKGLPPPSEVFPNSTARKNALRGAWVSSKSAKDGEKHHGRGKCEPDPHASRPSVRPQCSSADSAAKKPKASDGHRDA